MSVFNEDRQDWRGGGQTFFIMFCINSSDVLSCFSDLTVEKYIYRYR